MLPALHVITDDEVIADPAIIQRACAVLQSGGSALALHLRGHHTPALRLYNLACALLPFAHGAGSLVFINDRIDIARAAGADGVQLGARSIPLRDAQQLLGDGWFGYSAHSVEEALYAEARGTDFLLLGTIYASASHPSRPAAGVDLVWRVVNAVETPVIAIGGVTPDRVDELTMTGAYGVAVLGGVWNTRDPAARVARYIEALAERVERRSTDAFRGNGPNQCEW